MFYIHHTFFLHYYTNWSCNSGIRFTFSLPKCSHLGFTLTGRTSIGFTLIYSDNLVLRLIFLTLLFLDRLVWVNCMDLAISDYILLSDICVWVLLHFLTLHYTSYGLVFAVFHLWQFLLMIVVRVLYYLHRLMELMFTMLWLDLHLMVLG
jgi:hypothetical protein